MTSFEQSIPSPICCNDCAFRLRAYRSVPLCKILRPSLTVWSAKCAGNSIAKTSILVRREPLPMVRGDEEQLRSAFAYVFEFCGSMLKNGGNLDVEVRRKEIMEKCLPNLR